MDFSAIFAYLTGVRNSKNSGSDLEHSQLLSTGPNTSLVASHVKNIAELSSIFAYFTSVRNRINTDDATWALTTTVPGPRTYLWTLMCFLLH